MKNNWELKKLKELKELKTILQGPRTIVLYSQANKVSETPALPPEHQLERKNSINSLNFPKILTLNHLKYHEKQKHLGSHPEGHRRCHHRSPDRHHNHELHGRIGSFRVVTEWHYGPTEGRESPLSTEGHGPFFG